jgi:GT2 family glycosyltransferase
VEAPIHVGELELTEPVGDLALPAREDEVPYNGVRLLVRMQHLPVGHVFLPADDLCASTIARSVWGELFAPINALRCQAGLPVLTELPVTGLKVEQALASDQLEKPVVTVVVCTRNRPDSVVVTLRSLTAMQYGSFEIVVVDNAPSSEATREAITREFGGDPRVRYVREPRPGLSRARNRGTAEAITDIVAFTDDDVRVDPWWLNGIVRGFNAVPNVACVTGLVETAQIENSAQLFFDLRAKWGAECKRRIFDLEEYRDQSPLYPYAAGSLGAGANFSISRKILAELGGFDEALGAGTPSGGGEDLDIFARIILSGNRLVYEPAAIVAHFHRPSVDELAKQMRAYGSGCTAALTALMLRYPRARREIPAKAVRGVMHFFTLRARIQGNSSLPQGLVSRDLGGMMLGPWLYLKSRRRCLVSTDRS